jgi:hypothetical protein
MGVDEVNIEEEVHSLETEFDPRVGTFHQVKLDKTPVQVLKVATRKASLGHFKLINLITPLLGLLGWWIREHPTRGDFDGSGEVATWLPNYHDAAKLSGWSRKLRAATRDGVVDLSAWLYVLLRFRMYFWVFGSLALFLEGYPAVALRLFWLVKLSLLSRELVPAFSTLVGLEVPTWMKRLTLPSMEEGIRWVTLGHIAYRCVTGIIFGDFPMGYMALCGLLFVLRKTRSKFLLGDSRVIVYCPALLAAVLAECSYSKEEVEARGAIVARRAITPLCVRGGETPELIRGTLELAHLCVNNPEVFRCRMHRAGDASGCSDGL